MAGALFYAALAGFGVPIQRSLLMLAVFAWQWYRRGSPAPWRAWWQALAAVLLFDPLSALGVGFWFSFGAVAALIWVAQGRLEAMPDDDVPEGGWLRTAKHSGKWRTALRAQYAATLLGFWQAGQVFGTVPLAAPLANALLIPWFSWVLVPLALLAVLLPFEGYLKMAAAISEYTMGAVVWAGRGAGGDRYGAAEVGRGVAEGGMQSAVMPWAATIEVMEMMDQVRSRLGVVYPGE